MTKNWLRKNWTTSQLLTTALTAATLALPAPHASAAELIPLKVSILPIFDVAPLMTAIDRGFFAEEGLKVTTAPATSGTTATGGLVAGTFDIAYSNAISVVMANQQGLHLVMVAPGTKLPATPPDSTGLTALSDSRLRTGRDFEGHSIGVNVLKSVWGLYARTWVKKTGGDPDKVKFKEIPFPQMVDAITTHQVDSAYLVDPFLTAAESNPKLKIVAHPFVESQPNVEIGQYVVTADFLRKHPQVVAKFVVGLRKGVAWYNVHLGSPELAKIISGYTHLSPAIIAKVKLLHAPAKIDPKQVQMEADLAFDNGLLKAKTNVSDVISPGAQ